MCETKISSLLGKITVMVVLLSIGRGVAVGGIFYVKIGGTGDGSSWGNAFGDLQTAIDSASYGDTIEVAAGTYIENITLKNGVSLIGEVFGSEPNDTVIDANGSGAVVSSSGCDPNTMIQGFTVRNGNRGMYNENSSPTIVNCIFCNNVTPTAGYYGGNRQDGGGMYNDMSSPSLTSCVFQYNETGKGRTGGYVSSSNNGQGGNGGNGAGMYNYHSSPILTSCTFLDNATGVGGEGGYSNVSRFGGPGGKGGNGAGMYNEASSPILINCVFFDNVTGRGGSGGNSWKSSGGSGGSGGNGAGMYNDSSSPALINCTIINNLTGRGGYAGINTGWCDAPWGCDLGRNGHSGTGPGIYNLLSYPVVANCIIWDNGAIGSSNISNSNSNPTYSHCDVYGCGGSSNWNDGFGTDGGGNIDVEPGYDMMPYFHLYNTSPCIDTGDNGAIPPSITVDIFGNDRIFDGDQDGIASVDMGAYEFVFSICEPATVYVDDDYTPEGENDGHIWGEDAFAVIQDGINKIECGIVHVAAGIYQENIVLKSSVDLIGAGTEITTINGNDNGSVISSHDCFRNTVKGFTVINGGGPHNDGGMYITYSTLTVTDCRFLENSGRGMFIADSKMNVTDCTFSGNHGGMHNNRSTLILDNSTFINNHGSGMYNEDSSLTVTDCTFRGNSAGGMINYNSSPVVTNCNFLDNYHIFIKPFYGNTGGGMYNVYSSPIVTNCIFSHNYVISGGGGLCGGMYNAMSSPIVVNCTFSDNYVPGGHTMRAGGIYNQDSSATVINCILWNNFPDQIKGDVPTVTYSDVQGGWFGVGNIDVDPYFSDPGYWDANGTPDDPNDDFWVDGKYHLLPNSPCIDAGDPNYIADSNETDLDGNPRVLDGDNDGIQVIDMGAYEMVTTIEVRMRLTPQVLNCRSQGNWVKAHITLPEGFTVSDVDSNRPVVVQSFGIESSSLYVFVNKDKLVEIEASFEREVVCSLAGEWPDELTVTGFLTNGSIFLGTSTVRIIHPGMKVIEELALYWLIEDCIQPDFCDGIDMNKDSLVNLLDYALLMNINVEFVTDE